MTGGALNRMSKTNKIQQHLKNTTEVAVRPNNIRSKPIDMARETKLSK